MTDPSVSAITPLLKRAREALASTRYEFNSDYEIASAIIRDIDPLLSSDRAVHPEEEQDAK